MAQQVAMQLVEWKTEKVSQLVGKKPRLAPDGSQSRNAKGVLQYERMTKDVEMAYPVINMKAISDPSDLSFVVQEILDAAKPGFTTVQQVVEHLNHGLYRGPAVMLNKGQDIRLSASQLEALNTIVGVLKKGLLDTMAGLAMKSPAEMGAEILSQQGIPDALREIQVRLADDASSDDSASSDDE